MRPNISDCLREVDSHIKLLKKKIDQMQKMCCTDTNDRAREQRGMRICDMEARLLSLSAFNVFIQDNKVENDVTTVSVMAQKLGINIRLLPIPINKPKKARRLPYHSYVSSEGVRVLVGRSAAENDELSMNRCHRNDDDWWMHISNYSGAHVVICSSDDDILKSYPQTVVEAALLAASNSSCKSNQCSVDLTRCRNVRKNRSDPDGLVMIDRIVRNIYVDLTASREQLCSVQKTKNS